MLFDGVCVLITGAARGQGAAEARAFAAAGASVAAVDLLEADGNAVAESIGPRCVFIRADVRSAVDWRLAVDRAESDFGPIGVLVNNAGILHGRSVLDTTVEDLENVMRVNMVGPFLGIQAVVPSMRRRGQGAIVNVVSVSALRGTPAACAYVASKWALRGLTRTAAADLAPLNIRVNAVHPGPIDTPMISDAGVDVAAFAKRNADRLILGRVGQPDDVAGAVLFLASTQSAFITGAELVVDGGWTVR